MRRWSHGRIKTASDLESEKIFGPVRSYACRCGRYLGSGYAGVVCHKCGVEVIHRGQRAVRPGHVVLGRPVVHPWFMPVIARVLNLTQPEVKATSAEELLERLGQVDLVSLAEQLRGEVDYGSATRRAHLTPRLAIVETLIEAEVRPQWCVLEVLPVWPPEADLPPRVDRDALHSRFVEVLEPSDLSKAVHRVFSSFVKG